MTYSPGSRGDGEGQNLGWDRWPTEAVGGHTGIHLDPQNHFLWAPPVASWPPAGPEAVASRTPPPTTPATAPAVVAPSGVCNL